MANLRAVDKYLKWDDTLKRYTPNEWRRDIMPSWLMFEETDVRGPLTLTAAPAPTRPVSFKQPYTSVNGADQNYGTPFEIRSIVYSVGNNAAPIAPAAQNSPANANFTVVLKEMGEVRNFMNQPIHIKNLAGSAQLPAVLREPYFFLSQHNVQAQFTKLSNLTVDANMRMYLLGAQYYPWSSSLIGSRDNKKEMIDLIKKWVNRRTYVTPFWLTTDTVVSLPAAPTPVQDFNIKIGDDGHFEAFAWVAQASQPGGSTGSFEFEVIEVKTNQSLMNGRVTLTNSGGTASLPHILTQPYLIPAGYNLRFRVNNLAGGINRIDFALIGRKIYAPFRDVQDVILATAVPTVADTPTLMTTRPIY